MSNVFFILLLAVGFAGWKALDYFQLPNTFSILLLILTALSGILWCYHRFAVMPRRVVKSHAQNNAQAKR